MRNFGKQQVTYDRNWKR